MIAARMRPQASLDAIILDDRIGEQLLASRLQQSLRLGAHPARRVRPRKSCPGGRFRRRRMSSDFSAPSIALPCGSSRPFFKVTMILAFKSRSPSRILVLAGIIPAGPRKIKPRRESDGVDCFSRARPLRLDEFRPARARLLILLQDAEPARHFRISFDEPAHVAAEPVLVELIVRLDVP